MGMSKIEITITGNHGCGREAKQGEQIPRCGCPNCIDCLAIEFVGKLQDSGAGVFYGSYVGGVDGRRYEEGAIIRHWPGTAGEVVDDLRTGARVKGSF